MISARMLATTILFFALASSSTFAQTSSQIKLLQLNFNAETTNSTLEAKRFTNLENFTKQNDPDAVLIQECWSYGSDPVMAIKFAADMGMDVHYHLEDGVSGVRVTGLCMVTKKSLNARNVQMFVLPGSAKTTGNGQTTWVSLGEVNILIGAEITLPNGANGYLWTTHLKTDSDSIGLQQATFAITQIKALVTQTGGTWDNAYVFFTGDMNNGPSSNSMTYFRNSGLTDNWTVAHPNDYGLTTIGDIANPMYDPMVHGVDLFPQQNGFQETERIDYIYSHIPQKYSVAMTRTFTDTATGGGVWMSDHFAVFGTFDFSGGTLNNPENDEGPNPPGPTTVYTLTDAELQNLPASKNFVVTSTRGLTLVNDPNVNVQFFFTDDNGAVYPSNSAGMGLGDIDSFAFFASGTYKYRMIVRDYRNPDTGVPDYSQDPVTSEMDGTVQVQ